MESRVALREVRDSAWSPPVRVEEGAERTIRPHSDHSARADAIVGKSAAIRRVLDQVHQVAATDATVLLLGETGTGKELFATEIHQQSARRARAMVRVNCAAIPATLVESELFGREKGAFTDAATTQIGRFEMADRSTIFLDEIGDLPADVQVKLLRVLEERQIERLGSPRSFRIDTRIIAATHRNLEARLEDGSFREDLYYRLNVVNVAIPPLRERDGDSVLLAKAFLQRQATRHQKDLVFTPRALQVIESHGWPGNVRELENRIQRAAIMAENGRITHQDLGLNSATTEYMGQSLGKAREAVERQMIEAALARNKGNLSRAAIELEISRPSLYELIQKLGITRR